MSDYQLYLGDCLDIMRDMESESVECVFEDSPFNAGKNYLGDFDDNKPVSEYRKWLSERLEQMARILKSGCYMWVMNSQRHIGFCQMETERLGLNFHNIISWAYTNPTPCKNGLPQTWRPIILASKGAPRGINRKADEMLRETLYHNPDRAKSHYPDDLWTDIPKLVGGYLAPKELIRNEIGGFAHIAQMPKGIAERVIKLSTNEGETVFDPFFGSGTVAEVAQELNRKFIGCEINAQYFAIAANRINNIQKEAV